jgi:hypothetical protein
MFTSLPLFAQVRLEDVLHVCLDTFLNGMGDEAAALERVVDKVG